MILSISIKCHRDECCVLCIVMLNVIDLSVVILNVVALLQLVSNSFSFSNSNGTIAIVQSDISPNVTLSTLGICHQRP
jgi:hypothetical protein